MARADAEPHVWTIGRWRFDAALGTLDDGTDVRSLEHRAAATLAVLCRRRGDVVTREELIAEIWQGRAVSPNSVAVVIADLRRALDDDAKDPALLLTVVKRGYRLAPGVAAEHADAPPLTPPRRRRWLAPIGAGVLLALLIAFALTAWPRDDAVPTLRIEPVANGTGLGRYGALATALHELIVDRLARDDDVAVVQAPAGSIADGPDMTTTLVLWNGLPTLHMTVTDRRTGRLLWSGMAVADGDHIAAATIARLDELERKLGAAHRHRTG